MNRCHPQSLGLLLDLVGFGLSCTVVFSNISSVLQFPVFSLLPSTTVYLSHSLFTFSPFVSHSFIIRPLIGAFLSSASFLQHLYRELPLMVVSYYVFLLSTFLSINGCPA